jgi:UDP-glucose 4-epimerase
LLEAMRDHGVGRLVFSSSCATFGQPAYTPIDEAHPQAPISPYGQSKHMCEVMMAEFGRAHGLRTVALRYFNAAGADPEGRLGESHDPETHLVPLVLQAALGRRPAVPIFGEDYETPDGTCVRDYVHVTDLAEAHARALDRLLEGGASGVYNLGSETGHSVREVVRVAERVTGRAVPTASAPRRPGDPERLVATSRLARHELSFAPSHSDLAEIIATAWRWEQNRRY